LAGTSVAIRKKSDNDQTPYYARGGPSLLSQAPADIIDFDSRKARAQRTAKEQRDWRIIYDHLESRRASLYTWRLTWWTTWGQIARYMRPERYYYFVTQNTYDRGMRKDQLIVDRTATLCGEVCAAGLMAALTDPDREWLKLGPAIPGFEEQMDRDAQQWYMALSDRLNYVYTHSNFYDAQAQHYDDLVFFGNAPIIDYEDDEEILHCFTPCAGEYMLGAGFDFGDEVMYREFRLTVSQIVEMFGLENCPPDVQKMWRQKGGALEYEHVIGHAIEPNFPIYSPDDAEGVGQIPGGFTWREAYWIRGKKDDKPLSMSGFKNKPFAVSRWNTQANDAYGRGVGEYMLGDAIQLQLETRQKAESIEKVNRPPMGADVSLQNLPTSTNPGKITYFNTMNGEKKFFPLYEVKPDIPAITADIEVIQERLARTAYNDIFRMMETLREQTKSGINPVEIDALREEALMRMGPVIGRVYGTLRSRVMRHLSIMARRRLLPPMPDSLRGVPLKIDFVSMLTQAQKATRTQAIARTAQFTGSLSGVWPQARYVFDPESAIRAFNEGVGGDPGTLNSPQKVQQLMQQGAQEAQEAKAMAQTAQGAQAAAALGKTSLAPGNALSALVGSPGGGQG